VAWSGDHAIFLLVLTRPEGTDRRGLVLSRRNSTTLSLDPLSDEVMGNLLDGLVKGLPASARARIVGRAEGIPLYAIETVRSLLDKGVLDKGDDGLLYLLGELGELEIPPGLTALIASRLDALGPDERRLVKECSVLGASFARQAIEAVSDIDPPLLDDLLSSLVRKEVLTVRADKLSPERGQYTFTQSLIRSVAYDLLTRAERKARHLKTAEHLRSAFPDEGAEVAEVIGAHLYDAYKASGDDPDAEDLRSRACRAYVLAAERADSVGAPDAAESAYLKAVELSSDEAEQATFTDRAGQMAQDAGWNERAIVHFEKAIAAHLEAGRVVDAARITGLLGYSLNNLGRGEQAIFRIREALASLEATKAPPEVVALLQARLAGALIFTGHVHEAAEPIEEALTLAQHYELAEPLAFGLSSRAMLLDFAGRAEEPGAHYELSATVARRHGLTRSEMIAESNLADLGMTHDLSGAEEHAKVALALARRWGRRDVEAIATGNLMHVLTMTGRLDEALELGTELLHGADDPSPGTEMPAHRLAHLELAHLEALRGNTDACREHLESCGAWAEGDNVEYRALLASMEAAVFLAEGDAEQALQAARRAIDESVTGGLPVGNEGVRLAYPTALDAAFGIGDLEGILAMSPPGEVPPFLRAHVIRAGAIIAAAREDGENVEANFIAAESRFRDLGYPYWTARSQLDRAEWLARQDRRDESVRLATEAGVVFSMIGAAPMLARSRGLLETETVPDPGTDAERPVARSSPSPS
jgi:tetratricopeptide (TPR) repeat protein